MNGYLKQSTASQVRLIGPFLDDTDFKTAETGLTIANTDVKLRANGSTLANKNSGGASHEVNGMYSLTWDATDTANVGELFYSVVVAGALPVFGSYVVLEEAIYDALIGASATGFDANGRVDLSEIAGVAVSTSTAQLGVNVVNAGGTAWGSGAITAASLASDALSGIAAAVWAFVVEGSATAVQYMRGFAAALFGKSSGSPGAPVFRDAPDTKNRITATTDGNNNRTAVTTDLT